ncbi:TPA: hypothetical protein ACH3X2_004266 [Trebouxia sp. C0005]
MVEVASLSRLAHADVGLVSISVYADVLILLRSQSHSQDSAAKQQDQELFLGARLVWVQPYCH